MRPRGTTTIELRRDLLDACAAGVSGAARAEALAVLIDWLAERERPAAAGLRRALDDDDLVFVGLERPAPDDRPDAPVVPVFRSRRLAFKLDLAADERPYDAELVLLPPLASDGRALIGSVGDDEDDLPRRAVTLEPLLIGRTPVTWRVYRDGDTRRLFATHPATGIGWAEAVNWCARRGLRLPSEIEWEVAARAGSAAPFHTGERLGPTESNVDGEETSAVATYPCNAFGLFDVHGNVAEWCADRRGADSDERVLRGGSFDQPATFARCAARQSAPQNERRGDIGFRVARSL